MFIQRGLHNGAWVEVPEQHAWRPSAAYFEKSGFCGPTWYDVPLWDEELFSALPSTYTWSATKGPKGNHLNPATDPIPDPILSDQQRRYVDRLFTFCMGDEEAYSDALVQELTKLFAQLRSEAPDALLHTNQYGGEWNGSQMKTYMATCQPDLLTYDDYYFSMTSNYSGGSVTPLYNGIAVNRWLALGGWDQTFTDPIQYGQYIMGFTSGDQPYIEGGPYVISESEQMLPTYVTWTVGGKWTDLFRWEKDAYPNSLLVHHDESSSPTVQFWRYVALNRQTRNLSPYLTRLRSKEVMIVLGRSASGYNTQPYYNLFSPSIDPATRLQSVSATNLGGANGGLPGDVLIGTFRPIPNMNAQEAGWFADPETPAFMVTNGMAVANVDKTSEFGTGGSSADTAQLVSLTFDLSDGQYKPHQLVMVDPNSGKLVRPKLRRASSNVYETQVTMGGGTGRLFMWAPR